MFLLLFSSESRLRPPHHASASSPSAVLSVLSFSRACFEADLIHKASPLSKIQAPGVKPGASNLGDDNPPFFLDFMHLKPVLNRLLARLGRSWALLGAASLLWLVVRSGPKPQRLAYPCQKTAAANVVILGGLLALVAAQALRWFARQVGGVCLVCGIAGAAAGVLGIAPRLSAWESGQGPRQAGPQNSYAGVHRRASLHENLISAALPSAHRVAAVHNSKATTWSGSGNPISHMIQAEISEMVERGVKSLTGKTDAAEAWRTLIPYKAGEAVAIKLNFNNAWNCDSGWTSAPYMNPYPALLNAVIDGLKSIGVSSGRIWLTDPSRPISDNFRNGIVDKDVQYYTKCSTSQIGGRHNVFHTGYVGNGSAHSTQADRGDGVLEWINPAQVFIDAAHIINIPQLKGHGGASVTLGLKNHFGSVSFTEFASGGHYLHDFFYVSGSKYTRTHSILAEISANPVFKNKTRLIIGDGLMGHPTVNYSDPVLWKSFDNNPPEILFFGADPVAVDSVMFDYLQREVQARGASPRNDDILLYAQSIGLGAFERWNNSVERRYAIIDYVEINMDNPASSSSSTSSLSSAGSSSRPHEYAENDITAQKKEILDKTARFWRYAAQLTRRPAQAGASSAGGRTRAARGIRQRMKRQSLIVRGEIALLPDVALVCPASAPCSSLDIVPLIERCKRAFRRLRDLALQAVGRTSQADAVRRGGDAARKTSAGIKKIRAFTHSLVQKAEKLPRETAVCP